MSKRATGWVLGAILIGTLAWYGFGLLEPTEWDRQQAPDLVTLSEMAGAWTNPTGSPGNYYVFRWAQLNTEPTDPIGYCWRQGNSGEINQMLHCVRMPFKVDWMNSNDSGVTTSISYPSNAMILKFSATDHNHMKMGVIKDDIAAPGKTERFFMNGKELDTMPTFELVRTAEPTFVPDFKGKGSPWRALLRPFSMPAIRQER